VAETLRFWAALGGCRLADPAAALTPLGLAALAETPCRCLSSGQRRRLALSRLLVRAAPLWLLDEPAVGLDSAALAALGTVIARHRAAGGSVVLSTHQGIALDDATTLSLADFPWRGTDAAGLGW
jgi:heme exporter protein A